MKIFPSFPSCFLDSTPRSTKTCTRTTTTDVNQTSQSWATSCHEVASLPMEIGWPVHFPIVAMIITANMYPTKVV